MYNDYRKERCEICGHEYNNRDDVMAEKGFDIGEGKNYEPKEFSICDECADLHHKVCKLRFLMGEGRSEDMAKATRTILGITEY